MIDLKPCPFCGEAPHVDDQGLHEDTVTCLTDWCRLEGERFLFSAWQRRPVEDALRAELDHANDALTATYMVAYEKGKDDSRAEVARLREALRWASCAVHAEAIGDSTINERLTKIADEIAAKEEGK